MTGRSLRNAAATAKAAPLRVVVQLWGDSSSEKADDHKMLAAAQCDVDALAHRDSTAAHLAARQGFPDVVELLATHPRALAWAPRLLGTAAAALTLVLAITCLADCRLGGAVAGQKQEEFHQQGKFGNL